MTGRPPQHMVVARVALLFALLMSGCYTWPESNSSSPSTWTERWRTEGNSTEAVGLDPRAREIERNVGIH